MTRQPSLTFASKPRRAAPEAALQKAVIQHLRLRHKPGVLFLSIPNEAKRSAVMGGHLKAMGMLPGAADLLIVVQGRALFLELKAPNGVVSESQWAFGGAATEAGADYYIRCNLDDALNVLEAWGAIRPDARGANA